MEVMEKISIRTTNLFFLIFLMAYIGLSMLAGILLGGMDLPYWMLLVLSDAILVLPVVVFLAICRVNPWKMECIRFARIPDLLLSVVYAYTLMPFMTLLNMITMTFTDNAANQMIEGIVDYPLSIQLLLMAVMPAVVEEFLFRGIFREPYRKRSILGAACMSGLIFGIIHMNVNQCAYAFVMGVAFSLLVEVSGSILCPMVAHFAVNANSVLMLATASQAEGTAAYMEQAEAVGQMMQDMGIPLAFYVFALAFAIGGVAIAITILRGIAGRNGRLAFMKEVFQNGFRARDVDTTGFVDPYFLGAVAIGAGMMILNL